MDISAQAAQKRYGIEEEIMYNLSLKIVTQLEKRGHLTGEDKEILVYGFFSFIFNCYCFSLCVIIGSFYKLTLEAVNFFFAFLFIRRYAGGYHAKKEWMCLFLSSIGIFLSLLAIHYIEHFVWLKNICFILSLLSGIVICLFSPLEAENKPLSRDEKKKYRVYSIIRVSITVIAIIIFVGLKIFSASVPIASALLYEGVLIISGYLRISRHNYE